MIYVDNAATTYPKPEEVYDALDKANRALAFNAGRGESEESEIASSRKEDALLPLCFLACPRTESSFPLLRQTRSTKLSLVWIWSKETRFM